MSHQYDPAPTYALATAGPDAEPTTGATPPFEHAPPYTPADEQPPHRPAEAYGYSSPGSGDNDDDQPKKRRISRKTQRRLYWILPLLAVVLVLVVLFEVYMSDFERWLSPLADWMRARQAWSWVIPVVILTVLSFPPLFGHEIVQIVVGLTYPIGASIGIACAGSILGEAGCFVVFKYFFTGYVEKRIRQRVRWAAVARVTQEAGFRGVLVIRYSIVPPHLANPLFSCTGMKFWVYMTTVILTLPKQIVFVILGSPSTQNSKGAKAGKIVAIAVVVVITLFASRWIRRKIAVATKEIKAERAATTVHASGDEESGVESQSHLHK